MGREWYWSGNLRGKRFGKRQLVIVEKDLKKIGVQEFRIGIN